MNVEKISLPATINDTLEMVRTTAMKHNINLKKELDPELEFLEADRQKLKQILFNLLSNAVKFSKSGAGSITITTKKYDDCLLYTSDAADDLLCVDLGGRRI